MFYLDIGSSVDLNLTASLNKLSITRAHFKPAPVTIRMFEDPPWNVENIVTLQVEHPVTGQKEVFVLCCHWTQTTATAIHHMFTIQFG